MANTPPAPGGKEIPEVERTGSFPGYQRGLSLFALWAETMQQQSRVWNEAWGKLTAGKYEMSDWYRGVGQMLSSGATATERAVQILAGTESPPWVAMPWRPMSEVPVSVRRPVDSGHVLSVPELLYCGPNGNAGSVIRGNARVDGDTIFLALKPDDSRAVKEGPYMGFLFSDRYPGEPLAVLTTQASPY
jgi:hypothetical protein